MDEVKAWPLFEEVSWRLGFGFVPLLAFNIF